MRVFLPTLVAITSCQTTRIPVKGPPLARVEVAPEHKPAPRKPNVTRTYRGKASYYSIRTNGGATTASGQRLRNSAYTAAHPTLPMGTRVRVTNLRNGKSAVVRINDRGPYIKDRIIDVTIGVARHLKMITAGVVPCKVEVLKK
ncbi:septal ring lytic transglycosylase RlpA family protein [Verrucomicrobiales bacterium]|jgi:rare lipoprotein A|nr:septal ring lytic transglycosylase RlpA family protein [Verrucomicrobiales bacterium]MDC0502788.1 septal ring lytic transglycosylase RlpA family protein [Verrucomicrobiales bacterium]MDF1787453.1 septal ring lytic transglycosylase RlpA family protein [Verrucomicrobiales bacterium]